MKESLEQRFRGKPKACYTELNSLKTPKAFDKSAMKVADLSKSNKYISEQGESTVRSRN